MTESQKLSWKRLSVEAAAIVGSILLAFAIDAWWDGKQQRQELEEILRSLHDDFSQNLVIIDAASEGHKNIRRAAEHLMKYTGTDGIGNGSPEEIAQAILAISDRALLQPRRGSLDSILNSGRWESLDNVELRSELAEWPAILAHLNTRESQGIETVTDHLELRIQQLVPIRTISMLASPFQHIGPSQFPMNYDVLLSDMIFESIVDERWWDSYSSLIRMEDLRESTTKILLLLEAELQ
jgi:hypothetical protein